MIKLLIIATLIILVSSCATQTTKTESVDVYYYYPVYSPNYFNAPYFDDTYYPGPNPGYFGYNGYYGYWHY
jgi:hypothetical protein